MRVAFTGVSHWHLPLYLDPVLANREVEVVGVSDPDLAVAGAAASRTGCPAFADWRQLVEKTKPDFVFVLGRHCDMAEVCRGLLERGIAFAVEKPAGTSVAEVSSLADLAESTGGFAAVPFVFRQSRMVETIRQIAGDDPIRYLSFKFVAGSVDRYRGGSDWMLERALSGGGVLLNLGVHFIDLARLWLGPVHVEGAVMSNALERLDTEDHASVLLRAGNASCVIETGYTYPAPHMTFDMHFSIRTDRHHFAAKDGTGLEVIEDGGEPRFVPMPMSNVEYYPVFVDDVLERAASGTRPVADLGDMAEVMRVVERAYALSPL